MNRCDIERLYVARYTYAHGIPFMSDLEYDMYMEQLERENPNHELVNNLWYNDTIPLELLRKYNIDPVHNEIGDNKPTELENNELINSILDEIGSKSIKTIRSEREYVEWSEFCINKGINKFHMSIKEDGLNLTLIYLNNKLVGAYTKGMEGNRRDILSTMEHIVPNTLDCLDEPIVINAEIILEPRHLIYLRHKYGKPFKTARTSVITLLTDQCDLEDRKLLSILAFRCRRKGLDTLTDQYEYLKSVGFETPPYINVNANTPLDIIEAFHEMERLKHELTLVSDGVVLTVDDNYQYLGLGESPRYDNGNIALKCGLWGGKVYTSTLKGVSWTISKRKLTPVAIIDEVVTDNNTTVSRINLYNCAKIVQLGLAVGSEISFRFVGNAFIELVI